MMPNLPATRNRAAKHAGYMFLFGGLESVARALYHGDYFEDDTDGLPELARRCRNVADLIDARMREIGE